MTNAITGFDHAIVAVDDLDAAAVSWASLGFNLTPLGRHEGWGTANRCVMFEHDYLELLGVRDPTAFTNGLDERLADLGPGLLGVALGSADARATAEAWAAAGLKDAEVKDLSRTLDSSDPPERLRFANAMLPKDQAAGLNMFACQHLTLKPMRRPAWLHHPNSASSVKALTYVTLDPAAAGEALAKILGPSAVTRTDRVRAARAGGTVLLMATPEDAEALHPGLTLPPGTEAVSDPLPVAMAVSVASAGKAEAFLKLQNVPHNRRGDELWLDVSGLRLELVQGASRR